MQSQFQSQMQSQGLTLPQEPEVGPSGPRVSTKESCVAPSWNDPGTGDSDKCGLYIEENPSCLVALRRLYEGSRTVHNIPLLYAQVKVGVEEVKDAEALVLVPTDKVTLVGQTLNTFLAWPTHLVKRLSEHAAVSPAKPPESPDEEVVWDATIFGVFNQNFPFYIKYEDLSEIAHDAGNSDVYGFLESQSIQRSGQSQFESESYIKSWIKSSKRDVYLGAYLKGPDNYLKGIISSSVLFSLHFHWHNSTTSIMFLVFNTSALKGLDDTPQPKSKATAWWIVVKYFNEVRPLEAERFKALRIQWAQYYLKVRNQT
ncbi:hypothetical protein HKD37_14G039831 [Glycine soja]